MLRRVNKITCLQGSGTVLVFTEWLLVGRKERKLTTFYLCHNPFLACLFLNRLNPTHLQSLPSDYVRSLPQSPLLRATIIGVILSMCIILLIGQVKLPKVWSVSHTQTSKNEVNYQRHNFKFAPFFPKGNKIKYSGSINISKNTVPVAPLKEA